ncbi:MAG: hypothetical protein IV100_12665 [Myxococcales bacterium]|uniref:hypothetical protein n=1 Tax=Sediminibacterium sp. TaxID=1917865 RepID=UPI001D7B2486|nr:hypothetical protein [Sediminibacterium sp.]MBT9485851.1 hypothetical protein [Sediminibacterium sp.]MBT9556879.1 hypothetical protein [Myxococcales bacterium]
MNVGTWVTSSHWRQDPRRHALALRKACPQISEVCLTINDNAHARRAPAWHIIGDGAAESRRNVKTGLAERWVTRRATDAGRQKARDTLVRAVEAYQDAGFQTVDLMSWLRPERTFVHHAAEDLHAIFDRALVNRLHWDCEEAYAHVQGDGHAATAVELVAAFPDVIQAVTTYAGLLQHPSMSALAGIEKLKSWIVQAYATTSSEARPGVVQDYAVREWRKSAAARAGRFMEFGLPAYNQTVSIARVQSEAVTRHQAAEDLKIRRLCWYWASSSLKPGAPVPRVLASGGFRDLIAA